MKQMIPFTSLVVFIGLSGCGDAGPPARQAATPELPSETPRVTERVVESPGKTSAPIDVDYEILGKPAVGQPLEIRITTRSNVAVNALTTQVRGDEGLFVSAANASFGLAQMRFDEPVARTLTITPLREGSHRLSVLVQGEIGGVVQSNHVSIPIQVGETQPEPKTTMGTITTDEAGEAIISLPAEQN